MERSAELVAVLLAVCEAGAAYLPVDLGWPAARVVQVLDVSGAGVLVTDAGGGGDELARVSAADVAVVTAGPGLGVARRGLAGGGLAGGGLAGGGLAGLGLGLRGRGWRCAWGMWRM